MVIRKPRYSIARDHHDQTWSGLIVDPTIPNTETGSANLPGETVGSGASFHRFFFSDDVGKEPRKSRERRDRGPSKVPKTGHQTRNSASFSILTTVGVHDFKLIRILSLKLLHFIHEGFVQGIRDALKGQRSPLITSMFLNFEPCSVCASTYPRSN